MFSRIALRAMFAVALLMAIPVRADLIGVDHGTDELLSIDPITGAASPIGPVAFGVVRGLTYDVNNSTLWGLDASIGAQQLLTINETTGAATSVGFLGPAAGNVQSIVYDSNADVLYSIDINADVLLTIDPNTGFATAGVAIGFNIVVGLAYDPIGDVLYGVDADTDQLITIDPVTGGTAVGALGFSFVTGLAFDWDTSTLYGVDETSDVLLTINTSTGLATAVGPLGFGSVSSLAYIPVPAPGVLALLAMAGLWGGRRRRARA